MAIRSRYLDLNGTICPQLLFKASAPSGPWSEPIVFNFPGYDTSLAWTDSGECYVQGAHYWRVRPEILQYRIDLDTGAILPSPGFDAPDQPAQSHKIWSGLGGKAPEAPHQYYRDGWWYLLIAEGGTESGHMSTIARSRCLTAPHDEWEPCPSNPLLTSYPSSSDSPDPLHFTTIGHADLFQAPSGEWFAVALATRDGRDGRASMGRETVLVPAQWREREWPTADKVEGRMELSLPAVTADDKPVEGLPLMREGETEDILALCSAYRQKDDAWPPHLLFLRVPELSRYGLVSSSKLVLHPSRSTLAKQDLTRSSGGTTTFIGRRQTDLEGSMTCALTISTSRTISAGLATFLDETHHVTIDVTATENGARVAMEGMASAVGTSAAELTTQAGAQVELRIDFTMEEFTFSYREEGGAWTELGRVDSKELSGGFTGMVLGLWANTSADDELTEDVLFSAWQYASVRKY